MENSSIDGAIDPVASESKIPLILAIAAFVLGGLSFVLAWNVKGNLSRYKDDAKQEISEVSEKAKQLIADAQAKTNGGAGDAASKTDLEELKAQIQMLNADFQKVAGSQKQVVAFAKSIESRISRLENGRGASGVPAAGTPTAGRGGESAAATASAGKYVVQKGDYPASIAKKHGISLAEFNSANPGLDPKKLQIGQTVNIPEKK